MTENNDQWPGSGTGDTGEKVARLGRGCWETFTFWESQPGRPPPQPASLEDRSLGNPRKALLFHPPFLLPLFFPVFCVFSAVLSHRALWEKHYINNNKIMKGMSMREQEAGGGRVILAAIPHHLGPLCFPQLPPPWARWDCTSELEEALEIVQPGPSLSHMRKLKPIDVKWPA